MSGAYYNEIDPFTAAWLRELIKAGLIADGEVDERSITDVRADDMRGFTQCHFFAGIGGWSYALRLAGWPDDRAVWTGSCPCQPWSAAGKGAGADDSRDLWPTWFQLIRECGPSVVFGEQVASADGLGWFDRVSADLEGSDYTLAAADLCAAGIGAYHIRQRLWFVADTDGGHAEHGHLQRSGQHGLRAQGRCPDGDTRASERAEVNMAHAESTGRRAGRAGCEGTDRGGPCGESERSSDFGALDNPERERTGRSTGSEGRTECATSSGRQDERRGELQAVNASAVGELGNAESAGPQGQRCEPSATIRYERGRFTGLPGVSWADADWLPCVDGKARPVEPGTFPLAHGVSARVGRLRGYGNAIVPQVAQVFIEAYMHVRQTGTPVRGTQL